MRPTTASTQMSQVKRFHGPPKEWVDCMQEQGLSELKNAWKNLDGYKDGLVLLYAAQKSTKTGDFVKFQISSYYLSLVL